MQKKHSTSLNWMMLLRLLQKTPHFQASCTDFTQKHTLCPLENLKTETFIRELIEKNSRRPNVWKMIDHELVVLFMQKSDESDQEVPTKSDFKG